MTFDGVSPMADLRRANGREKPWTVDYFAVGNETWGCGGNMVPEYYANLYKHYQTFVKQYNPDKKIKKLAVGPTDKDYNWTETMLRECFRQQGSFPQNFGYMDGLTLHYYTLPYDWDHKGSATKFNDKEWYMTLAKTFAMEEFIEKHSAIMDRYDPDCRIGLMVDEWGTWYDVEEGTNPGFLYQQNTIRDALIACINLNIFNKHCKRVKMANIAQLVNVLQAPLHTMYSRCSAAIRTASFLRVHLTARRSVLKMSTWFPTSMSQYQRARTARSTSHWATSPAQTLTMSHLLLWVLRSSQLRPQSLPAGWTITIRSISLTLSSRRRSTISALKAIRSHSRSPLQA